MEEAGLGSPSGLHRGLPTRLLGPSLCVSSPTPSGSFSTPIPCHTPESHPLDSFPGSGARSLLCSCPDRGGALGAGGTPRLWRLYWWEPRLRAAVVTAASASAADSFLIRGRVFEAREQAGFRRRSNSSKKDKNRKCNKQVPP